MFKITLRASLIIFFTVVWLLFAISTTAKASTEVGMFIASKHLDEKEYNETNPGVYVIYNGYTLGVVDNSYDNITYLAGYTATYNKFLSVGYGLVHGYGWENGYADVDKYGVKTLPYILPTFSYSVDNLKINMHYIGIGVALSLSYQIN